MLSLVANDRRFTGRELCNQDVSERHDAKRRVDELSKTLHTLSSLLLTNKTIRRTQQGFTE
jgi:hypothetical protein